MLFRSEEVPYVCVCVSVCVFFFFFSCCYKYLRKYRKNKRKYNFFKEKLDFSVGKENREDNTTYKTPKKKIYI